MLFERRIAELVRVSYYRFQSAGSALTTDDVLPALRPEVRMLHLTGITAALSDSCAAAVRAAAQHAHAAGITVSLDVNYRSRLWTRSDARLALRPLLAFVDVIFASEDELPLIAADQTVGETAAAQEILEAGVQQVVVKRGAAGATAHLSDRVLSSAARQVTVVDLVGARDAFVAGYLSALLDGEDAESRLDRAVTTAAFAVSRSGDWEGLPTRDELALLELPNGTTVR